MSQSRFRIQLILWMSAGCSFAPAHPSNQHEVRSLDPAPQPVMGGTMERVGDRLVIADPDRDQIHVVSISPLDVLHTFELPEGSRPGRIAISPDHVWVLLQGAGEVASIALNELSLSREAVCPAPRAIAAHNARRYVACAGGLLRVSQEGGAFETVRLPGVPLDVRDIVPTGEGLMFSGLRGAALMGVSVEGDPARQWQSTPDSLPFSASRPDYYQPSAALRARDTGGRVRVLYASARQGPPLERVQGNPYLEQDNQSSCGNGTLAHAIATVSPSGETFSLPLSSLGMVLPVDFDVQSTPTGSVLAVVSASGVGGAQAPLKVFRMGGVRGCRDAHTDHALPGQAVSVVAVEGRWAVQLREPSALWLDGEVIALDPRSVRDTGHDLFHAPLGEQAACASCHLEGLDDGHLWTEHASQPERTLSLAGRVSERPGYSWKAHAPELHALIDTHFAGVGGTLSQEQTDAFVNWLDALEAPPLVVDDVLATSGSVIFARECASCHGVHGHSPSALADLEGEPTRVPDLVGVGMRVPLMRDGCADSLETVLRGDEECGGTAHRTDGRERPALIEYLRSL